MTLSVIALPAECFFSADTERVVVRSFAIHLTLVVALTGCSGLEAGAAAQSATSSQPSITPFSGTLLRIEDQGRVTVALATSEGILLADPLSLETARALKDQFAVRFPNQPVRYVVYTHHHFERASGASVFNQTAEILAHEGFGQERQVSAERLLAGETRGGRTQSALYEAVLAPERVVSPDPCDHSGRSENRAVSCRPAYTRHDGVVLPRATRAVCRRCGAA